jgi:hypothetical protein
LKRFLARSFHSFVRNANASDLPSAVQRSSEFSAMYWPAGSTGLVTFPLARSHTCSCCTSLETTNIASRDASGDQVTLRTVVLPLKTGRCARLFVSTISSSVGVLRRYVGSPSREKSTPSPSRRTPTVIASHRPSLERSATEAVLMSRMSLMLNESAAVAPAVAVARFGKVTVCALARVARARTPIESTPRR